MHRTRSTEDWKDHDDGFTLIELLVVMIIIGILAAIAIPTFLNQRNNGYRTQLKSDLVNTSIAVETAAGATNGDYTAIAGIGNAYGALPAALGTVASGSDQIQVKAVSASQYCLKATNSVLAGGTEVWYFDKLTGIKSGAAPTGC